MIGRLLQAAIAKLRRIRRQDVDKYSRRSSLTCHICGQMDISLYMVKDEVWAEAGLGEKDFAHPTCLAKRLGRPLRLEDFTSAPCNDIVRAILGPINQSIPTAPRIESSLEIEPRI